MNQEFFKALQRMVGQAWPGTAAIEITIKLTNGQKAKLPVPVRILTPIRQSGQSTELAMARPRRKPRPISTMEARRRTRNYRVNANKRLVYFVQAAETLAIKIGSSTNPTRRLGNLQSASAYRLRILGTISGGRAKEMQLHREFDAYRLNGEWFSGEILDHVKTILSANRTEG